MADIKQADQVQKDTFVFHNDWFHAAQEFGLSAEEFMSVIGAAVKYTEEGIVPAQNDLGPAGRMMFMQMRQIMDKDFAKWQRSKNQHSEAGKKSAAMRAKKKQQSERNSTPLNEVNESNESNESNCYVMSCNAVSCSGSKDLFIPPENSSEFSAPRGGGEPEALAPSGVIDPEPDAMAEEAVPPKPKPRPILSQTQSARFDRWYAEYPNKVAKAAAMRAWKKLDPSDELTDVMIRAVQVQRERDRRFREGFIPHPATWLNGREWENEYTDAPVAQNRRIPNDNRTDWDAVAAEWERQQSRDGPNAREHSNG